MQKTNKFNILISNINLVNLLFGFGLVTSLFFSNESHELTTTITIPFRVLSLAISLVVIYYNINKFAYISKDSLLVIVFYIAYIVKIFISINSDISAFNAGTNKSSYYINSIGIVFFPLLSVIVSSEYINFNKILKWSFYVSFITILLILFKSNEMRVASEDARLNGNIAVSTITFGHIGTSMFILSLSIYRYNKFHKILAIFGIISGVYIAIISGSRSPILALLVVILIVSYTFSKYKMISILISIIFIFSLFIFSNTYLHFIDKYSHVSSGRIALTITEGDSGNRDSYYSAAIDQFVESPIIGDNFVLKKGIGKGDYPHNLILEAMLAFGFLGGIILIYLYIKSIRISYVNIKNNTALKWLGLLFFQFLIYSSLHGALWGASQFIIIMGLILTFQFKKIYKKTIQKAEHKIKTN